MEIKIMQNVMHANQKTADANRTLCQERDIFSINIMASPGAGKTSLIKKIIDFFQDKRPIYVVQGDIASDIDAQKIQALGIPVVQINTVGGCHLDANMIQFVLRDEKVPEHSIFLIENVGNLVCPSNFDLGENMKWVIASAAEGDDKPYKYVSMFACADLIILNKIDLIEHIEFDKEFFYKGIRALNESVPVFEISCRTGAGLDIMNHYIFNKISKQNV